MVGCGLIRSSIPHHNCDSDGCDSVGIYRPSQTISCITCRGQVDTRECAAFTSCACLLYQARPVPVSSTDADAVNVQLVGALALDTSLPLKYSYGYSR